MILLALFIGFFAIAHAEEKIVRIKTKKKKPAILLNPKLELIPLEKLIFKVHQVSREEVQRRLQGGGDDVGNGGDEIRRKILQELEQIKAEVGPGYQIPDLSTRGLAIVSGLELAGIKYPAVKTTEGILIDREAFKKLIASKVDLRILILDLLFIDSDRKDLALTIYSSLGPKKGLVPFCHSNYPDHLLIKSPFTKTFKGSESMKALSKNALSACRDIGLEECRVIETGKSGFAKWATNFAVYQGHRYSAKRLTSSESKNMACELAKKCEQVYELAPLSQVGANDFRELESQIDSQCF